MTEKPKFKGIYLIRRDGDKTHVTLRDGTEFDSEGEAKAHILLDTKRQFTHIKDPILARLIQEILGYRFDYGRWIWEALQEIDPGQELRDILETLIFQKECVYQAIHFKREIKNEVYTGDTDVPTAEMIEASGVDCVMDAKDCMSELVKTIGEILGEGNYSYDYWGTGGEDFTLFFWIRPLVYVEKMQAIGEWAKQYGDLVSFEVKSIDETKKGA